MVGVTEVTTDPFLLLGEGQRKNTKCVYWIYFLFLAIPLGVCIIKGKISARICSLDVVVVVEMFLKFCMS